MCMTTQYLTDSESFNALKSAPAKHRPTIDTITRNILERVLLDLMHIRDCKLDTDDILTGYIGMDVCTSVLARLVDGSLPDNTAPC